MNRSITVIASIYFCLLLSSCVRHLKDEINASNSSIEAAKSAGAERYSPETFAAATKALKSALTAVEKQNSKLPLFRNYYGAKTTLASVNTLANKAVEETTAKKAVLKAEVIASLTELGTIIAANKELLAKAPRRKEGKAALEAIGQEIASIETVSIEVTAGVTNNEDILTLSEKIKPEIEKAKAIITELKEVNAKREDIKKSMESDPHNTPSKGTVSQDRIGDHTLGKIGYKIQDTMKVGNQFTAIATITKAMDDSVLFMDMNVNGSDFKIEVIRVSSKVKVTLIDPSVKANFSIIALNSEEQVVDANSNTKWVWNITPLRKGQNQLMLRATIKVITEFGETPKDISVFEKIIYVQSSPILTVQQFIFDNWQWIAGTIVIPISVWRYTRRKNRRIEKRKITGFTKKVKT